MQKISSDILQKSKNLIKQQKYRQAEKLLLSLKDSNGESWQIFWQLGIATQNQNKWEDSYKYLKKALKFNPDSFQSYNELGLLFQKQKNYKRAIQYFKRAIQIKSNYFAAYFNLGNTLKSAGKYDLALNSYKVANQLNPKVPELYLNIAVTLEKKENLEEAINILEQFITIFPEFMEGYNKLGLLYKKLDLLDKAENIFQEGISKDGEYVRFYGNLANVLQSKGEFSEALKFYDKAIKMEPNYHEAIFSRSLLYLLMGNFEKGWNDYESRWNINAINKCDFPVPEWDGQHIGNKRLLLWSEQGLGDSIQFIRYAPLIKQRSGKLIVKCQRSLKDLFKSIPAIDKIVTQDQIDIKYDYHIPMLSLPRIFRTREATIPAQVPYLKPDKDSKEKIQKKLDIDKTLYNIGFVWAGNSKHKNDQNRSCNLEYFLELNSLSGIQLFSIQKGVPEKQLGRIKDSAITNLSPMINNFSDTAAIIEKMDLVISVDTSVAHLAGALGKKTWLILPHYCDWRWMLERTDSPWYPTMRIFRQDNQGNWDYVFHDIKNELANIDLSPDHKCSAIESLIENDNLKKAEKLLGELFGKKNRSHYYSYLLARIKRKQKYFPQAINIIKEALRIEPEEATYLYELGLNYFNLNEFGQAESAFIKSINKGLDSKDVNLMLAKICQKKSRYKEANDYFHNYFQQNGNSSEAFFIMGKCNFYEGKFKKSIINFQKVIAINPDNDKVYLYIGLANKKIKQYQEAVKYLLRGIRINPNSAELYNNLGNVYKCMDQPCKADNCYRKSIELEPEYFLGYFNLAKLYHEQDNLDQAVTFYKQVLDIKKDFPPALNNYGTILLHENKFAAAERLLKRALAKEPESIHARITLGNIYNRSNQYEKALKCYYTVLAKKPASVEAHANLGSTYFNLRQFSKSLTHLEKALEYNSNNVDAHWNRSITLLAMGRYKEGWREYEWRWRKSEFQSQKKNYTQPPWDGSIQQNKTLLIWHEQGYGDTIQFVRLVKKAHTKVNKIILAVPAALKKLLQNTEGVDRVIEQDSVPPDFDIHCPIMSLPRLLNLSLKNIPNKVPYLSPAKTNSSVVRSVLRDNNSLKAGFVWAGSSHHKNDHLRSCSISNFAIFSDLDNITFYSFQKGPKNKDLKKLKKKLDLIDLDPYLNNFSDTGNFLKEMDVIISVDTSVAHLAGALGKKTWIILPKNADWRWMTEEKESRWYPTVTLFRQKEIGDWSNVFKRINRKLLDLKNRRGKNV